MRHRKTTRLLEGGTYSIGNRFHNGHIQKKEHEISRRVALLDKDELEITDDGLDVNLSSQSMATMFMQRTKLVVDPKKLRNHHTKKSEETILFFSRHDGSRASYSQAFYYDRVLNESSFLLT